jgi:hypothetical protein
MCGRQAGPKSPNLKKMLEEAFHPFRKRHTASLRSNGIGNKLFEQVTAEEWVTQAAGGNLKHISRGLSSEVSERGRMS